MTFSRDSLLDGEGRMLVESVAAFRSGVLDEIAADIDGSESEGVVLEAWGRAAKAGLTAALTDEDSGGQGMDACSFSLALEEIAMGSAGFAAMLLSHNLALWALEGAGACAGASFVEGDARAALAWPFMARHGGGEAPFVPGGARADALVFLAPGTQEVFRVSPGEEGVSIYEIEAPMGLRCSRPAALEYSRVGAPSEGTLGPEGAAGLEGLLLLGVASMALGLSRQAYERATAYASERYQGGDLIINHEQMRLMLAEMLAGIEAGQALVMQAAHMDGPAALTACRIAKVAACDTAVSATGDGLQIHGGYGYVREYGMERLMRDAKYCQVYPWPRRKELLAVLSETGE